MNASHNAETRWLNADEQRAWRNLAGVMITLPSALDTDMQAKADISHFDYLVLSTLSETGSRIMRMSELAAFTNSSLSRLSHVVSRLEKRGWIRREPCPEDGRYTNALLTDTGYDKVVETAPGHVEAVRTIVLDGLEDGELVEMERIASKILERIRAFDASGGKPG